MGFVADLALEGEIDLWYAKLMRKQPMATKGKRSYVIARLQYSMPNWADPS